MMRRLPPLRLVPLRAGIRLSAVLAGTAALAFAPVPGLAQDIVPLADSLEVALKTGPLLPEEVLRSSALTFPSILESFEREAAARSDQLAADGAFDLMLRSDVFDRVTGFNDGGAVRAQVTQPLQPFGAQIFGGYTLSDGRLPTSQSSFNSPEFGRVNVGALFSLLRDSNIDPRRFALEDTRLATSQAQFDVMLVQLNAQQEALRSYWRWVAAGEEIRVFEELLEIAEARQIGLTREVNEGARARIALTENEQNLLIRRSLLEEAKRNFVIAANSLGFFLRGRDGQMIVPTREQLPDITRLKAIPQIETMLAMPISEVISGRPELETFRIALERAANRVELRRNDLQPRLDAAVELATNLGNGVPPTSDTAGAALGVTFSVPLQRREARGRLQRAEAELRETELRRRRVADQLTTEVGNIIENLSANLKIATLADAEVKQATAMVQAERTRFRLGAGEFFLVNAREEAAANAQIKAIRAKLAGRLAEASYNAATMNLKALGLE
jgi:outer membrane protein TolC